MALFASSCRLLLVSKLGVLMGASWNSNLLICLTPFLFAQAPKLAWPERDVSRCKYVEEIKVIL